jgi:hypothetical protein
MALGSLEQGVISLESAVNGAKALGSTLRYRESHDIYQQMLVKWSNEEQVKALARLFR